MRQLIVSAFVSADGIMQAPGGPDEDPTGGFNFGGWIVPYADEVTGEVIGKTFERPFDLVLGRKTYEIFAAYWPYYKDEPHNFIAQTFNRARKYVATRSEIPLTWENSVILHDAAADLARLKQEDGPDLVVQGSSDLIKTLLKHGLIDRMTLLTFPVILGTGKRFFGDGAQPMALKLESTATSPSGVTVNTYVPDGAVKTGSFVADNPSTLEIARRKKMRTEK